MVIRRRVASVRPDRSFKGRQFTAEVILWAIRWHLMFPVSYRDLELTLADRSLEIAHTTIFGVVRNRATPEAGLARPG
jgi:IS6 family transposase